VSPSGAALEIAPGFFRPPHIAAFLLASTSIGSLLLYFSGVMGMPRATLLLVPATLALAVLALWARGSGRADLFRRIVLGLWAGSFATLAYDVVRVPLVHAGIPIFKAISYFGTIMISVPRPTLASEVAGWTYHLSNGIGFAIMYTLLFHRPGWLSAVVWSVFLEVMMLVTPYAEVFGYRRSPQFFAITMGAHVFYGLGLWLAARYLDRRLPAPADGVPGTASRPAALPRPGRLAALWLAGPVGIGLLAADFHGLHARKIPVSPPPYVGPDLYVTWDVPEPDRIGAVWLMRRFVEPGARFHFVEPMSRITFGTLFDIPEADIRRGANRSAFEDLLSRTGRAEDPALQALARMCYATEIRPWAMTPGSEEHRLAAALDARLGGCRSLEHCLDAGLAWFEETYRSLSAAPAAPPAATTPP
jgi:hypothetical protein